MSNWLSTALRAAIDRDNRNTESEGGSTQKMSQILEDLKALIDAGSVGITAAGGDVDALALGGGHFAQDPDTTTGLTFGYKAGRFIKGNGAVVTVSAGTLLLTASNTNYMEVDSAGTVSSNTSGFTAGRMPLYTILAGTSGITSVTNSKCLLTGIFTGGIVGAMLATAGKTKELSFVLGDISATASFTLIAPGHAGTLAKASFATKTAITANDTDYWTWALVNKGPSGSGTTAMLAAGAGNTTQATGGSAVTAYVKRDLTLHGTPANLAVAAGDVLELTVTKAASATTMAQCSLRLDVTFEA